MVAQRGRAASEANRPGEDWPHLVSFGTLLGAVLGVLLLGALLRSDVTPADTGGGTAPTNELAQASLAAPPEPRDEAPDRLVIRALADADRLGRAGAGWTAQLGLFCDPNRIRELLDRFGDQASFHVLPSTHGEQTCYRVCWGRYSAATGAKAARDLPGSLREIAPAPLAKPIDEVLE